MNSGYKANPADSKAHGDASWQRRYDVDWLRTLAMGLLIIYHVAISFQPWAHKIFFPKNEQALEGLWKIMSLLNIWRIPILFLISGMGVRFAMERRNWKQLLKERTARILLPFIFGFFLICSINSYIAMKFYGWEIAYLPNPGHLWFLGNIFLYVLLLLPLLIYLKNKPENALWRILAKIARRPWVLFLAALPLMAAAWLLDPDFFVLYVLTPHGFCLGMICFATGFIFISLKDLFWQAVENIRQVALAAASLLYLVRLFAFRLEDVPHLLVSCESMCWMLAILGYGSLYLNKPSARLAYFSKAVYPVYIIHMPVQHALSYYLLPLQMPPVFKLILLLAGTFGVSLLLYEYLLKRLKWVRPLFGMKGL